MNNKYKQLPSIEALMNKPEILSLIHKYGRETTIYAVREAINEFRSTIKSCREQILTVEKLTEATEKKLLILTSKSFRQVINATGIILHTNLGRAPLDTKFIDSISNSITGYSNLEFDLSTGKRTNRLSYLIEKLKFITNAEDAVVVNNNAAAIILILNTFAKNKEAIISRGELVEIGDSFRIHEIMEASNTIVKEVGSTNKTKLEDYRNALSEKTGIIVKVHKSNYSIKGFTSEVSIKDLANFSQQYGLPFVYDQGSGLIKKPKDFLSHNEPDVITILKSGADIVTFSGDKLMGGPQAGIIVGRAEFINKLKKSPIIRALRIDKLTITALEYTLDCYIQKKDLPIFRIMNTEQKELKEKANILIGELQKYNIKSEAVPNIAKCGGGTLPETNIKSYAVKLNLDSIIYSTEKLYNFLLICKTPVVGILKQGNLFFDILTIEREHIPIVAKTINESLDLIQK